MTERTSSARSVMMPEMMRSPPGFRQRTKRGAMPIRTSATMFARIKSTGSAASWSANASSVRTFPAMIESRSSWTPFSSAFSPAILTASGSMSTAVTSPAPRSSAAIDRIPLPQPMSSTFSPSTGSLSSIERTSRVVLWPPVPKAMPGFRSSCFCPGFKSTFSHSGTMIRLPLISIGW